jgi:hypothetical protein
LIRLFAPLLGILGTNMDLLTKLLPLVDSYVLLDASNIVQVSIYLNGLSNG